MARRRKKNPSGETGTLLLLGGVGVLGYLAYTQGWLSSLFGSTATTTTGTTPLTPGTSGGTSTAATNISGTPALGTPITSNSQVAMQVMANYPYIIPVTSSSAQKPGGYTLAADTNAAEAPTGQVWVRNDIAVALLAWMNKNYANAPATIGTLFTLPVTLAQIQSVMQTNGLSGMGFVRAQSNFPSNPIMDGAQITNVGPYGRWN